MQLPFFCAWNLARQRLSANLKYFARARQRLSANLKYFSSLSASQRDICPLLPSLFISLPPPSYYTIKTWACQEKYEKNLKKFLKKLSQLLDKTYFALYNIYHEKRKNNRKSQKTKQESFTKRDCW